MVASLGSGTYVSDKNNVHFHMGPDLKNSEYIPRVSTGAIEGSGVVTYGSYFGVPGKVALWTAKDGVYLGMQDGQVRPFDVGRGTEDPDWSFLQQKRPRQPFSHRITPPYLSRSFARVIKQLASCSPSSDW